ncbi:MAG: ATP-binding protein [Chloroflexota bacterium]|nr:ATP-binding protein [Chloroflexota bacterium]
MKHKFFEIRNFKGIHSIHLSFEDQPRTNIYTLVGLNESGKTTILEALNFPNFRSESDFLNPLELPEYAARDVHELIPISKRSNFHESIEVEVGYKTEEHDEVAIRKFFRSELNFDLTENISQFSITRSYKFEDSKLTKGQPRTIWMIDFVGRSLGEAGQKSRTRRLSQIKSTGDTSEQWQSAVRFVRSLVPSVLYFPNFLFEFPDKIYLEPTSIDPEKHAFYRTILQDVLDSTDENLDLQRHVLERAKSVDRFDKQALESVLLKMGSNITSTVFGSWNRIFKRKVGNKEIVVGYDHDDNGWFLQLRLKDAHQLYAISERSLGFRWFFAFLLLTQYRGFRKDAPKNVLFLFDEPASNLHPSAQTQLLDSFGKFPKESSIIYTTHSHHMINPDWLEGTFVVRNEGLDYESEDDTYNAGKTLITLEKYRNFAAQHPDQSTYFQPILDVLDYSPGRLENIPSVVMLEGKNDFFTLNYFQNIVLDRQNLLNLLPGGGSGTLDDLIRLYIGWGRQFIVLLDADNEGKNQKNRYSNLFGVLVQDRIFSLDDIEPAWRKKGMEFLIDETDRITIQNSAYPSTAKFNKTHFNRAVQELYLTNQHLSLSATTKSNMERILDFCAGKLS